MRFLLIALLLSVLNGAATPVLAQAKPAPGKREYVATRTAQAPTIDGELEAEVYGGVAVTQDFTRWQPEYGAIEEWPTRVRVLYDDRALYVAAELWYPTADSISREVRPRDDIGNADFFGITIDPYRSGVNGFGFYTTAVGGQFDAIYADDEEDENWDAVWRNAVTQTDSGWTVEVEIPYSAIRFPDNPVQTWAINFVRRTAITQSRSAWNPFDPNKPGFIQQSGRLTGITDISPPPRIQASPFGVVTSSDYVDKGADQKHTWESQVSGGVDLKLGLSDAFTLDMTLIPDFSEARQDNQVLNLSPFEVRFDENRPFFTEGVELFTKGNFFYSRRVGGTPLGFDGAYEQAGEEVLSNPQNARLLNATKVSGRTEKGLGIGVFNAVSGEATARLRNPENEERDFVTQPLTNYNVTVFDQLLPNNSYVSLINTSVLRSGSVYDANLTGLVYQLRNKANTYGFSGQAALSQKYYADADAELGHQINASFGDIDGAFTWEVEYDEWSAKYDQSDLGFQRRNNYRELVLSPSYNKNDAFGPFNNGGAGANFGYERYIDPEMYSEFWFNVYAYGNTKDNWNFNPFVYFEPVGARDIFEARTPGRFVLTPSRGQAGMSVSSDRRKSVYFNTFGYYGSAFGDAYGRSDWEIGFEPSYRVTTQLNLGLELYYASAANEIGYADRVEGEPVLGRRDRGEVTNSVVVRYTITPRLGFDLRGRHYWSRVRYAEYLDLTQEGGFRQNLDYAGDRNETYNALTWDLVARWRFAPGSDLLFVYKNALFQEREDARRGYFKTWNGLYDGPRTQTFTLKVNYWLDWGGLRGGG